MGEQGTGDGDPAVDGVVSATRLQLVAYGVVRAVVAGLCRIWFRLEIIGADHVPGTGAFVLAPVHRSNVDTPVVSALTRRRLRFMGKAELWRYPATAWFFSTLGGFPVERGTADREALRRCEAVLRNGEALVIFPEGTRRRGPVVDEMAAGAAFVANRTGVPIVPVGIGGTDRAQGPGGRMVWPTKVVLVVGEPIWPEPDAGRSRKAAQRLNERLREALQVLYDEAEARVRR